MPIAIHPAFADEPASLGRANPGEARAMREALRKLGSLGRDLGFPHCSAVRGANAALRELRPRAGHAPWRALYALSGDRILILALAPEAVGDRRRFRAAVARTERRLIEWSHDRA